VHYPVKSGKVINIVVITADDWNAQGWSEPASRIDLLRQFSATHWAPPAHSLIRVPEAWLKWALYDRRPLMNWSHGAAALLGDAAHPMLPRGANGAAQAILDCHALCDCLARTIDPVEALKAYEDMRLPITSKIVLTNRENPPDAILREVYLRTGDKPFSHIEDVIDQAELGALSERYQRVAGFDKQTLRSTPKHT
jgi:5-methylphenazine-1-carboxylate 1-monooxygenase